MITQLQEGIKERGLKIILWIVIIAMVLAYLPALFQKSSGGKGTFVATINGIPIDAALYHQRTQHETERLEMVRARFGSNADTILKSLGIADPQETALNNLMYDALIDQVAQKAHVHLAPSYAVTKLNNPSFVVRELADIIPLSVLNNQTGRIDERALRNYLARYNQTLNDFEVALEQKIRRSLVTSILETTINVTQEEVFQLFLREYQPRSYDILTLTVDDYLKKIKQKEVSSHDLSQFLIQENKRSNRYWTPEERSGRIFVFDPQSWGIDPTKAEVESFYNQHKALFVDKPVTLKIRRVLIKVPDKADQQEIKALEQQAQELAEKIRATPSQFSEIAQKTSAVEELPPFSKGTHHAEFEKAAFRLAQDNDIAGPITTDQGFEIIQRVGREPISYKSLDAVENTIKERLRRQNFQSSFSQQVSRIITGDKIEEKIEALAAAKKAKESMVTISSKKDSSLLAKKLFSLNQGRWGFFIESDKGYIVQLAAIKKSYEPKFSDIKNEVLQDYYDIQSKKLLAKDIAEAQKIIDENEQKLSPELFLDLQKRFGASKSSTTFIVPHEKEQEENKTDLPVPLGQLTMIMRESEARAFLDKDGGAIIRVNALQPVNTTIFVEKKEALAAQLWESREESTRKGFVASLYRNATIDIVKIPLDK